MKKFMKKTLSVFLVVLLLFASVPMHDVVDFQFKGLYDSEKIGVNNILTTVANAEASDSIKKSNNPIEMLPIGFYSNEAFSSINSFLDSYSNKADLFDYYKYSGEVLTTSPNVNSIKEDINNKTIADKWVDDLTHKPTFVASYAFWKGAGYIADPVEFIYDVGNITSEAYYETILLKCLESEIKNDALIDLVYKDSVKNSLGFLKNFYKACETFSGESFVKSIKRPLDDFEYEYLANYSEEWIEYNVSNKLGVLYQKDSVKFISNFLKTSSSLEKYAEKLASFVVLANLSDSIVNYIEIIAKNSTEYPTLADACNEVVAIASESFIKTISIAAFDGITSVGKTFFSDFLSSFWKDGVLKILNLGKLSSGAQLLNGVLLGIQIGKTIGNICFSTDKVNDKFEMTKCLIDFLNVQRKTFSDLLSGYDGSTEEAILLCDAVDMLYQSYGVASDLVIETITVMQKSLLNFYSDEEYESAKKGAASERNFFNNRYNNIKSDYQLSKINDNASWIVLNDGSLLIIGKGEINTKPWESRANEISQIYISSGITSLGDDLFKGVNLENSNIVMDGVSSITGTTFANALESCNLIFNTDVYFDAYDSSADAKSNIYVYGNAEINARNSGWCVDSINCTGDLLISSGEVIFNRYSVVVGTLTASQWSTIYVNKNAQLICNNLVGRAWAYQNAYRTSIVNEGSFIVTALASGFINWSCNNTLSELSAKRIYGEISISGGVVNIFGTSSFSHDSAVKLNVCGNNKCTFYGNGELKSLDVYASGLTIANSVTVNGYLDFHGNDVIVNSPLILTKNAYTKRGSNYKHIRLIDGYYLCNDIVSDIIEVYRNLYVTSGSFTLTGMVKGTNELSYAISINSGLTLTVDGDIYGEKNFIYSSEVYSAGKFKVTGTTSGYLKFSGMGEFELNNISLTETQMKGGDWFISGNVNNLNFVESANVEFCGSEQQQIISSGTFGICEITNRQGVVFTNKVVSTVLFNHNRNPFTLKAGGSFVDYDKDGKKDNVDPYPLDPFNEKNDTDFSVIFVDNKLHIVGYSGNDTEIIIPDSIAGYDVCGIKSLNSNAEKLYIGDKISSIDSSALENIKEINISENNNNFLIQNGILYSYDMSTLIRCLADCPEEVVVPGRVRKIEAKAFSNCNFVNKVVIPYTVTSIDTTAFSNCGNTVIHCYNNSAAFNFAKSNRVLYQLIKLDATEIDVGNVYAAMYVGVEYQISTTLSPKHTDETVIWSIADPDIVYINQDGTVIPKQLGKTTITATSSRGTVSKSYEVEVIGTVEDNYDEVNLVSLPKTEYLVGESIIPDIHPYGADNNSWVGLYLADDPEDASVGSLSWIYTCDVDTKTDFVKGDYPQNTYNNNAPELNYNRVDFNSLYVNGAFAPGEYKLVFFADNGYIPIDRCYFTIVGSSSNRHMSTDKTVYKVGEGIRVTATGTGTAWVGLYKRGEIPSQTTSYYWYYVQGLTGSVNTVSGMTYVMQDMYDNQRIPYGTELPAGAYSLHYFEDEYSYTIKETINFTIVEDDTPTEESCSHENFDWITDKQPTCKEEGSKHSYCLACNETLSIEGIAKLNHTGGTANCTDKAICLACGEEYGEINTDNHKNIVIDEAVDSTCKDNGFTEGSHCEACGEVIVEQIATEKLPHKYNSVVSMPTCTSNGFTTNTCVACGYSYVSDEVPSNGHTESDWITDRTSTCAAEGSKHTECTECGEVIKTEAITKLPHEYTSVVTKANCESGGYTTYTCSNCSDSYVSDKTPATGHNYVDGVCTACGESKIDNCSHMCHKSGFMGFIWKIVRFFWKLFGMNPVCNCGVKHY